METLIPSLLGGTLIGCAAVLLRLGTGRIAGISGLLGQVLTKRTLHPALFLLGLGIGGWLVVLASGTPATASIDSSTGGVGWLTLLTGGLLVGVGTRLGSGCTSGHGVCGNARRSPRSFTATVVFMSAGMLVATAVSYAL